MAYNALHAMRQLNRDLYREKYNLDLENTVRIPDLPACASQYGKQALSFLREQCEDLKFDTENPARVALADADGRSAGKNQIPYNMERDLDRLCLERAAGRFLASGSREDAFDIYYCYCEIFHPFGTGYNSTGILLEMLSEHEANASSLLMKHRDHYAHAVYVFLIGLAIFKNHEGVRKAYLNRYGLTDGKEAACHFLEYWGLASLFHDIGYPFEIAHQQMMNYVCSIDPGNNNEERGFAPFVSYRRMDEFSVSRLGDLNEVYARAIVERLEESYLPRAGVEPYYVQHKLINALRDRAVHENPLDRDQLYMDHAYFSGLTLLKTYLTQHMDVDHYEELPMPVMDAFCAVTLHNSLFKFTLRSFLHTREPLSLADGQPLAYLLMLCDELQCWDRTSYGQNTRAAVFACDFDMTFPEGGMSWTYVFDQTYESKVLLSKAYKDMLHDGYTKKSGAVRENRSKFVDDIDEIIRVKDVVPAFEPNVRLPDPSDVIQVKIREKQKKTGLYLSDSNYLNLYDFALALNGRYAGAATEEEMRKAFEENLSLEYKLSNIAQAKGFAAQLETIGCFYTDRPVDYAPVTSFQELIKIPGHENDLTRIAIAEHERWCAEKRAMGWQFGTDHVGRGPLDGNGKPRNDNVMRDRTRMHHDLVDYGELEAAERFKDTDPMEQMAELIKAYDGLTIYRMK